MSKKTFGSVGKANIKEYKENVTSDVRGSRRKERGNTL